jgi:hypothetical protein
MLCVLVETKVNVPATFNVIPLIFGVVVIAGVFQVKLPKLCAAPAGNPPAAGFVNPKIEQVVVAAQVAVGIVPKTLVWL